MERSHSDVDECGGEPERGRDNAYIQKALDLIVKGLICKNGRGERIRTSDPLVPNQVRYQTALRPENLLR